MQDFQFLDSDCTWKQSVSLGAKLFIQITLYPLSGANLLIAFYLIFIYGSKAQGWESPNSTKCLLSRMLLELSADVNFELNKIYQVCPNLGEK